MMDAMAAIENSLAAGWTPDEIALAYALKFLAYETEQRDSFCWLLMGMFLMQAEPEIFAGVLRHGDEQGFTTATADQLIASLREKAEAYRLVIDGVANASR